MHMNEENIGYIRTRRMLDTYEQGECWIRMNKENVGYIHVLQCTYVAAHQTTHHGNG